MSIKNVTFCDFNQYVSVKNTAICRKESRTEEKQYGIVAELLCAAVSAFSHFLSQKIIIS
jgi:hypothetical protein